MNYLCDDNGLLNVRSRVVTLRLLDRGKIKDHRVKWQIINTLLPILVIIGFGFLSFYLRKRKYSAVALNNQTLSSDGGNAVAITAYLTLIGFIIASAQHSSNKTKLGAYHLRQVVGFMVTGLGFAILILILALPMLAMDDYGDVKDYSIFIGVISFVIWIAFLISIIVSLVNAVNGREKPAPIFGKLYEKWFANMFY